MNRKIKHRETLVYYDGPQLFLARDQVNAQYLCLLVDDTGEFDKFLCVPISSDRLDDFYRGEIDLRKIYEDPESGELFYTEITENIQRDYQLVPMPFDNFPKEWLPEPGFIFKPERIKQELIGKVIKADSKLGAWTLRTITDEKDCTGIIEESSGVTLKGIIIEDQIYKFFCEERFEEVSGNGRAKRVIALKGIKKA